ncbi:MAG TPA: DUF6629 family protein [Polyangiaceae bacterium]
MCFSSTASFAAAAFLSVEGLIAVRVCPTRRHTALACIPLLFAVQQICEGVLWWKLGASPFNKASSPFAYLFLFFAFGVWPAYLPAALALFESGARRRLLVGFSGFGVALGAYLLACLTLRPTDACFSHGSLYYWVQIDAPFKTAMPLVYLAVVVAPFVVSSMPGTSFVAVALGTSFVVSAAFSRAGFLSTWCFFAAVLSGVVALALRAEGRAATWRRRQVRYTTGPHELRDRNVRAHEGLRDDAGARGG